MQLSKSNMQGLYDHLISERKKVKKALQERRSFWAREANERELTETEIELRYQQIGFREGQMNAINHVLKYIRKNK